MPCWEVNLITVEFKAKNIDYLTAALKELNINFYQNKNIIRFGSTSINLDNQTIETNDINLSNQIKRKYSEIVIKEVAKKKKWIMKMNQNKIQLKKY